MALSQWQGGPLSCPCNEPRGTRGLSRPFRAFALDHVLFPGRCPGLIYYALSGLDVGLARHARVPARIADCGMFLNAEAQSILQSGFFCAFAALRGRRLPPNYTRTQSRLSCYPVKKKEYVTQLMNQSTKRAPAKRREARIGLPSRTTQ